jgi:hypothetical protein
MEYPKLVTLLRQGLKSLYETATELEQRWLKEALLTQPPRRSASGVVEKPQKSGPDDVQRVESFMAANPDLLEARLLSGLAVIKERLGKQDLSSRRYLGDPNRVHRVESPTAVNPELWESQLLSGLATMQEGLGKRVRLTSKRCVLVLSLALGISMLNVCLLDSYLTHGFHSVFMY